MDGTLTIGQTAKLTGATVGALRQGEARGRFPRAERDRRGWRRYDAGALRGLLEWRRSLGDDGHQ